MTTWVGKERVLNDGAIRLQPERQQLGTTGDGPQLGDPRLVEEVVDGGSWVSRAWRCIWGTPAVVHEPVLSTGEAARAERAACIGTVESLELHQLCNGILKTMKVCELGTGRASCIDRGNSP